MNEIKRMQQLAGLISEGQLNEATFGLHDNFQWKSTPAHPGDMVRDEEEGDYLTKDEFWRHNVTGLGDGSHPNQGRQLPDGTWVFYWDAGEMSGFVEGEDFTYSNKEKDNVLGDFDF
jgi:hypothetical protein